MNIIKKYIMESLEALLDKCKFKYFDLDMPGQFLQLGYLDLGYDIEFILNNIKNLRFDSEQDHNYTGVGNWNNEKKREEELREKGRKEDLENE